jgi:hypothetical protein
MKYKIAGGIILLACVVVVISFKKTTKPQAATPFEPVAVIELFTSQGCSSCPPADKLMAKTITDAKKNGRKIFALSFHVDYWNRLGWKDPFSDSKYSQRQNDYVATLKLEGAYTPQMIVNGRDEFVGSDTGRLTTALSKTLTVNAAVNFKSLSASYASGKGIKINYVLEGNFKGCTINFALVSLKETTAIERGENKGLTLTNENVVRQFATTSPAATAAFQLVTPATPVKGNAALIAFVQQQNESKIIGAAMTEVNME